MIKYVVQIICEQETCGSGRGLKFNTCKEMGAASHSDPSLSFFLFFFLFSCKFHLFFFLSSVMFKFIIRHLSDCTRPIAALFKKQQQKETCEGLVSPSPAPSLPPARFGRTPDDLSALWFGALMVCVWNFEKNGNSSEIGKMQNTGR